MTTLDALSVPDKEGVGCTAGHPLSVQLYSMYRAKEAGILWISAHPGPLGTMWCSDVPPPPPTALIPL